MPAPSPDDRSSRASSSPEESPPEESPPEEASQRPAPPRAAQKSEGEEVPPKEPASSPQSGAPGEDVPLQGTHQGETEAALTSSVRAQEPPDPTPRATPVDGPAVEAEPDAEKGEENSGEENGSEGSEDDRPGDMSSYQLSHDPESGQHRVRVRPPKEGSNAPGGGFKELSRHSSPEEMSDALDGQRPDGPRFVVLENTETGEAFFDREGELSDNWFAGGRYDQATVFDREDEAAAYADRQQQQQQQ